MENENRKRREEYEQIYSVRSQQETRQLLDEANATLNHASGLNVARKSENPLVMAPQCPVFVGNGQLGHGTLQQERHQNSPLDNQMAMYPAVGQVFKCTLHSWLGFQTGMLESSGSAPTLHVQDLIANSYTYRQVITIIGFTMEHIMTTIFIDEILRANANQSQGRKYQNRMNGRM